MARGYDEHQERLQAVNALGRPLSRRSGSACELCDARGTRLDPFEVAPIPEDPAPDLSLLACERCHGVLAGAKIDRPDEFRFLAGLAWSEIPPVQVTAIRLLRRIASEDIAWARETLDNLYLDPEIESWVDRA